MASHATPTVGRRTWRSIASAAPFAHRRGRSQSASARVLGAGSSPARHRLSSSTRPWRCSRPVGRPSRSRKRSPSAPHAAVRRCPDYSPEGWHEVGARLGMRAVAAARSSSAPTLTPGEFGGRSRSGAIAARAPIPGRVLSPGCTARFGSGTPTPAAWPNPAGRRPGIPPPPQPHLGLERSGQACCRWRVSAGSTSDQANSAAAAFDRAEQANV